MKIQRRLGRKQLIVIASAVIVVATSGTAFAIVSTTQPIEKTEEVTRVDKAEPKKEAEQIASSEPTTEVALQQAPVQVQQEAPPPAPSICEPYGNEISSGVCQLKVEYREEFLGKVNRMVFIDNDDTYNTAKNYIRTSSDWIYKDASGSNLRICNVTTPAATRLAALQTYGDLSLPENQVPACITLMVGIRQHAIPLFESDWYANMIRALPQI